VQKGFDSVASLEEKARGEPGGVGEVAIGLGGADLAITPFLARFFEQRNNALLYASMGLQVPMPEEIFGKFESRLHSSFSLFWSTLGQQLGSLREREVGSSNLPAPTTAIYLPSNTFVFD